ncbi:protein of unknown function [Microlunatus sagamiharensis]|uniref:DUF4192 domain-containing protein n=1 Tax=Microlunatus sagamiharensis TaxID=546874 RepID=A0A1H2LS89_9ACTN|nr:DUF4192 domain-containing protein [Microlunatus sagamiharensis]SDU83880.1 protein of unknown function [Microlunatus sagamiharensis]
MTTSYRPAASPDRRPDAPVRLRVREPADLLATVPYLLGFHPTESLVALFLRDGRVLLAARFDLARGLAEEVADLVEQHAVTGLVLVAYAADGPRGRAVLEEHRAALAGVELVDLLLVDGRRWWSLTCTTGCCPAEGRAYAPAEHPISAEAVYAGLVARPDRESVVDTVAGPPEPDWAGLRLRVAALGPQVGAGTATQRQDLLGRAVVDALARVPEPGSGGAAAPADDDDLLVLALLARETVVRDVACALVTREDARRHVDLWSAVVRRVPPEVACGPLGVLGIAAWADGNGTLLNACCERLERLDPAYPMGRLLSDVSRRALAPAWWDAMADGLRHDLGMAR